MTYYHISLEAQEVVKEFIPSLPSAVYVHEDKETPRISLSDSIEGCLSAVPWGGRKLEHVQCEFTEVCDEEMNLVFRVYEFDDSRIQEENIVSTERLVKEGLVMDAENSGEVWVIHQALKPSKTYLALLNEYDEELKDVFDQEYHNLTEEDWEEMDDIDEFIIGASTKIVNATLSFYDNVDDIPLTIDWETWNQLKADMKEESYESPY